MPDDSAILTEIKSNWDYARNYWRPIRAEAEKDVLYSVEGPWDADDRQDRKGRVTISPDEFTQYLNQICNEFRQHQRSVKVNPRGDGADDQTALIRAAMIREIEYQSKALQAYVTAGENMVRRSYGYVKLVTDWEPGSFRRMLKLVAVANPEVIYLDPDFKEPDASDCDWAFEIDTMRESNWRKKFGEKATITDFDGLEGDRSGGWVTSGDEGRQIRMASYWRRVAKKTTLYLLENGQEVNPAEQEGVQVVKDGKKSALVIEGQQYPIADSREDNDYSVVKYLSNGLEILETAPTDFSEVPVIPFFGREVWVTKGSVSRRTFESAIRHARESYKAYCYVCSAGVERLAMDPKTPYEGWEGQFDTQTDFTNINKVPQGYVEFKIVQDPKTGDPILDKPRRNLTEPQIHQYEMAAESWRRRIQSAIGGSPLPTSAQRQNQKSGVALDKIEQSNDQGNFHFIDNYDRSVERAGRMMDQALDIVYDTPREVGLRSESGDYSTMHINQRDEQGQPTGFHTATGDHGVTISSGLSSQSMRDAADNFCDQLAQNETVFPKIADLVVKLKNLGPIGDQIAERLAPPGAGALPPGVAQQIQAGQQQIQQMQQEIAFLKQGDAIKKYTVDEQEKTKRVLGLVKVDQQDAETRLDQMLGAISDRFQKLHDQHQTLVNQQHEREMADAGHQRAMEMQAAQPEPEPANA